MGHILDRYGLRDANTHAIAQMARALRHEADALDTMAARIDQQED